MGFPEHRFEQHGVDREKREKVWRVIPNSDKMLRAWCLVPRASWGQQGSAEHYLTVPGSLTNTTLQSSSKLHRILCTASADPDTVERGSQIAAYNANSWSLKKKLINTTPKRGFERVSMRCSLFEGECESNIQYVYNILV